MAVRIRLKRMGRTHRPFYRVCAMDSRTPRDGRVIEELGHYDPMVPDTDARAVLNKERIDHWLSVGAKPSENVSVLIKKYGTGGTHLQKQEEALQRLATKKPVEIAPVPPAPKPEAEEAASEEAGTQESGSEEAVAEPEAEAAEGQTPDAETTEETAAEETTE